MDVRKVECQTLVIGAGTAGIEAYKSAVSLGVNPVQTLLNTNFAVS